MFDTQPIPSHDPVSWSIVADWHEESGDEASAALWRFRGEIGRLLLDYDMFGSILLLDKSADYSLANGWKIRLKQCARTIRVTVVIGEIESIPGRKYDTTLGKSVVWRRLHYGQSETADDYYRRRIWELADRIRGAMQAHDEVMRELEDDAPGRFCRICEMGLHDYEEDVCEECCVTDGQLCRHCRGEVDEDGVCRPCNQEENP